MMDVLVKFPTRSRPDLFRQTLALYQQDQSVRFLISCDNNDPTMNNPAMKDWLAGQERTKVRWGESKSKIEAINDGLKEEAWNGLMILAADDMIPTCPDYAQRIAALFRSHFPNGDGVLHLNDGRAGRSLNTLPILDRKYFDRTGYVYHPSYISVWADNEFQAVSERLGRTVYINEVLIRHAWTDATGRDDLHLKNESFYTVDHATFERRRAVGFPTPAAKAARGGI